MRKQSLLNCALKQSCDTTACTMHQTSHDAYLRHTTNCRSPQQAPLPKASSPATASGAGLPRGRTASGVGWPRDREWYEQTALEPDLELLRASCGQPLNYLGHRDRGGVPFVRRQTRSIGPPMRCFDVSRCMNWDIAFGVPSSLSLRTPCMVSAKIKPHAGPCASARF